MQAHDLQFTPGLALRDARSVVSAIRSQQQRQRGWKLYSFHTPEVEFTIYEGMRIAGLPED
jgi:hypothetical protein